LQLLHALLVNKKSTLAERNGQAETLVHKKNVWAGILNNKIICPHFIDGTLNSSKYAQILTEILPLLLKDLSLNVRQSM